MRQIYWLTLCFGLGTAELPAQQPELSPKGALAFLKAGNERFVGQRQAPRAIGEGVRRSLAEGQRPKAILVCCADSRVTPEHIFDCGLGEVFVIRTTGNTCDPATLASIEHAALQLGSPLCVFMAHDHCDAVAAAVADRRDSPAQSQLLDRIYPALQRARREGLSGARLLRATERENAYQALSQAFQRSPKLRARIRLGQFALRAARYELHSGRVTWLPERPLASAKDEPQDQGQPTLPKAKSWPPQVSFRLLMQGHRRYLGNLRSSADLSPHRRKALVERQNPFAIVVTCADSRVPPEILFDTGLGEIFVVRVAGNIATPEVVASIEHAAARTGASYCLVLGHRGCGALHAALEEEQGSEHSPSMRSLLDQLSPAIQAARHHRNGADLRTAAARLNALHTVHQLRRSSKILRDLEQRGQLQLDAAIYDLQSGEIDWQLGDRFPQPLATLPAAPLGESKPASRAKHPAPHTQHQGEPAHIRDDSHADGHASPGQPGTAVDDKHAHPAAEPRLGLVDLDGAEHAAPDDEPSAHDYARQQSMVINVSAAAIISIAAMMCLLFWQNRPRRKARPEAAATASSAED